MFSRLSKFSRFFSEVQSVPNHKPPAFTDIPSGRYAGALFSAASRSNALRDVKNDLENLRQIIKASPLFKDVLKNSAVSRNKQREIFATFAPQSYHQITQNFL
jgi:F0F1-type ATP synthase delta subunit